MPLGVSLALACAVLGVPLGCSPESKPKEVSAQTSGFRPAEATAGASKPKPQEPKPQESKLQEVAQGSPSRPDAVPGSAAGLPSFTPGQVDPAIAAKSYMTLKMTDSEAPEELVKFVASIDRAMMDLQTDANSKQVNSDTILNQGLDLLRMKLTASDRLRNKSTTPDQTAKGWIGKLEALQQMAMFRDVPSADEVRTLSKELSANEDPRVAKIAQRIQLQLLLGDYRNQTATADQIVAAAKGLLDQAQGPDKGVFMAVAQAAEALSSESQGGDPANPANPANPGDPANPGAPKPAGEAQIACNQIVDALEAKFRDVPDPNVGMMAWRMKIQRLPDFESYLQVLDTRQAMAADPVALTQKASSLMEKIPSPWTAMALSQCATQFEYSGNVDVAKSLLDIAATQLESTKTPEIKAQIQMAVEGFQKRIGSIGKPLALEGLVDTQGQALDKSKYEGKVVLVDFWATWCGPCVAEIPNIRRVYDEKHAEGFEVIAVNLDDQRSDLDEFLGENKMPWNVYVSNDPTKAGMDTALAQELSISAIPFTMLIGRDGNVVAVHVRGKALDEKVQQLLGAKP
jgi:thiol-disulfide isomerase/thioredoxin